MDTIFALASARGKAGVAVIRISGPESFATARQFCSLPEQARQAAVRTLRINGERIDQALVLRFDAPGSFTGEDVVELHVHGSVAIVEAILNSLAAIPDVRLAEAGEFTRRALENDRIDVIQAEGLSDLIEAETEAQRKQAERVFSGALGRVAAKWRADLVHAASLLEATIDFVDEDVPVDVLPEVIDTLAAVHGSVTREIAGHAAAERIREGFEVAIVGAPNVGKSTLLNALAGREAAITSEFAGTTRDVIEVRMDLRGLAVTFLDTAGVRDTDDAVEAIGVERALERANGADLRILLKDDPSDRGVLPPREDDIVLTTKADVRRGGDISARTGHGLQHLVERVTRILNSRAAVAGLAIRVRHRVEMERAAFALETALDRIKASPELTELVAEDVRTAIRAMDSLVGRVDVEHILDEIFASFCIGK